MAVLLIHWIQVHFDFKREITFTRTQCIIFVPLESFKWKSFFLFPMFMRTTRLLLLRKNTCCSSFTTPTQTNVSTTSDNTISRNSVSISLITDHTVFGIANGISSSIHNQTHFKIIHITLFSKIFPKYIRGCDIRYLHMNHLAFCSRRQFVYEVTLFNFYPHVVLRYCSIFS